MVIIMFNQKNFSRVINLEPNAFINEFYFNLKKL